MSIEITQGSHAFEVTGGCIDFAFLVLGPLDNNTYILSDDTATIVVDPSAEANRIMEALDGKKLDAIFCTHHHADHVGALKELVEKTGALVYASPADARMIEGFPYSDGSMKADPCSVDILLEDNQKIQLGNMVWEVLFAPGHTPGGVCFMLRSQNGKYPDRPSVLVTGDTLFCGTTGRTDFEGGNPADMKQSLVRLSHLPEETIVLPGHYALTTIGDEKDRMFARFC